MAFLKKAFIPSHIASIVFLLLSEFSNINSVPSFSVVASFSKN